MAPPRRSDAERPARLAAVLSVLAATLLWAAVKLSRTYDTFEAVAVRYELPAGLTFAEAPPRYVEAAVGGTGWDLLAHGLLRHPRFVVVDSARFGGGAEEIPLAGAVEEAFVGSPLDVRRVLPERIRPRTSRVAVVRLPVRLRAALGYATNHAPAAAPVVQPDSVTVTGPASRLSGLRSWPTDTLVLTGLRDTVVAQVALATTPGMRTDPAAVGVRLATQQITERQVSVPITVAGARAGDSLVALPRRALVTAVVALTDYERLRPSSFAAVVDAAGWKVGAVPLTLPVELRRSPDFVLRARVRPATVSVYVVEGLLGGVADAVVESRAPPLERK